MTDEALGAGASLRNRLPAVLNDPDVRAGQTVALATLAFLVFVQVLFPAPPAVLFLGAVLGSLNALVAMGLVLIYRANRIVSFAQGDLGALAGVFTVSLVAGPGWPFLLALAVGLLAALLTGAAVEFLVVRRFAAAPRLILTVATIGVAQVLAFGQIAMPSLFGFEVAPQNFPTPWDFTFEWHPLVFRGSHVLVLILVPVMALGLTLFLRSSRVGLAMRAAAESADRSLLLGIPVKRINTLVWMLAALLSGAAAAMRAPIVGVSIGTVLGPALLLRALAAAVIGRMTNLGVTFAAAVLLGVAEQAVFYDTGRTLITDAVLFVVIVAALLLQRRGTRTRAEDSQASTWTATAEAPPLPISVAAEPAMRWARRGALAAAWGTAIALPLVLDTSRVNLLGVGAIRAMVGLSLLVLTGWAGQLSLGQMAIFGFGAAAAGWAAEAGADFVSALLVAGVAGIAVAVLLGIPALRISGPFLAVATLGFALATSSYLLNPDFFSWLPSSRMARPVLFGKFDLESERTFYYLLLILLASVLFALRSLRASRSGRVMLAIRENSRAAGAFGIDAVRTRLLAFAVSGLFAALAGGAFFFHQHGLGSSSYRPEESLRLFSMVVIGGLGSVVGVLSGTVFFTALDYFSPTPELRLLVSGSGLLVVLLLFPGGLGQALYLLRDRYVVPAIAERARRKAAGPGSSEGAE